MAHSPSAAPSMTTRSPTSAAPTSTSTRSPVWTHSTCSAPHSGSAGPRSARSRSARPASGVVIIPSTPVNIDALPWHNWAIKGWKLINDEPHLIAKPWLGRHFGDKGFAYFSRATINKLMAIDGTGAFTCRQARPDDIKRIESSLFETLFVFIGRLIRGGHLAEAFTDLVAAFRLTQTVIPAQTTQEPAPAPQPPETPLTPPAPLLTRTRLYNAAVARIHTDASPQDRANDEFGCAESLSHVIRDVIPDFPIYLATAQLLPALRKHLGFIEVAEPQMGCVSIFATVGPSVGHCGVWGKTHVMSNTSATGKWEANYTHAAWYAAAKKRGLAVHHFLPL
jgi:hypothetical protein